MARNLEVQLAGFFGVEVAELFKVAGVKERAEREELIVGRASKGTTFFRSSVVNLVT
ncbi:MAG: hypothetical protein KAG61_07110 [Bacteriovoracaceae bacterium]|nr:hypothetical protein [Bacteriovoracaceae bacterium]